ncbi:ATP-dependent RNA helicase A, partial [Perkinsus olseni]
MSSITTVSPPQVAVESPAASTGHYAQGRPRKELYEYCQKKGLKLELRCDRSAPTAPWVCVAIIEAIGKQSQGTGLNKAKASDDACLKLLQSLGDSALVEAASGSKKKGKKSLGVDTAAMEWYECSDPETPPTTSSPGGAARSPAAAVFRNGPAGYNSDNAKAAVFEWLKRRKMPTDFVYRAVNPKQPSTAGWTASYNHPVPLEGMRLTFTETASNKKIASQYLALDICSFLYERGLMPANTGKSVTMSNGVTNQMQRTSANAMP